MTAEWAAALVEECWVRAPGDGLFDIGKDERANPVVDYLELPRRCVDGWRLWIEL